MILIRPLKWFPTGTCTFHETIANHIEKSDTIYGRAWLEDNFCLIFLGETVTTRKERAGRNCVSVCLGKNSAFRKHRKIKKLYCFIRTESQGLPTRGLFFVLFLEISDFSVKKILDIFCWIDEVNGSCTMGFDKENGYHIANDQYYIDGSKYSNVTKRPRVASQLSPHWLYSNSYIFAYDIRLHIVCTKEPKNAHIV